MSVIVPYHVGQALLIVGLARRHERDLDLRVRVARRSLVVRRHDRAHAAARRRLLRGRAGGVRAALELRRACTRRRRGRGRTAPTIDYTLVALGVVRAAEETVNGVVGWVEADELALLDRRERHYDRVDVTDRHNGARCGDVSGSVAVYVPAPRGGRALRAGSRCGPGGDRAALLGSRRSGLRGVRPGGARPVPQHHAGARRTGDGVARRA